jgi:hypothetical protein
VTHVLPSGSQFQRRVIGLSFALCLPALMLVPLCLFTLLEITGEQRTWLLRIAAAYALIAGPLQARWQSVFMSPVADYLDRRQQGEQSEALRQDVGRFQVV